MNMTRWLIVAACGVLTCTWAQADSVPPPSGHYLIDLEAWDANQEFGFTPNPSSIPIDDLSGCLPVGDFCGDASIRVDAGGGSTPESGSFDFSAGPTGTQTLYFDNTGAPITSIEIQASIPTDELGPNNDYSCSGGAIFEDCGFFIEDPPGTEILDIFFYHPYSADGIPSIVPEPSEWTFLLVAGAAILVAARRKSAISSSAQTQRLALPTRDS